MKASSAAMAAALLTSGCTPPAEDPDPGAVVLAEAFAERRSNVIVQGTGVVTRLLSDDRHGDRHQRFLLEVAGGQSLLIVHNIDVAPRLDVEVGDRVEFAGEYDWNSQGGLVHWTHRTAEGPHPHGWLKHRGRTYQ